MLIFHVINKRNIELPFTIKLKWNSKEDTTMNGKHDIEDATRSVTVGGSVGGTSFDRMHSDTLSFKSNESNGSTPEIGE